MTRKRVGGFTLVEMMVVVAIIGILSAIAVPAYSRFLLRSQTAEATNNLLMIYNGMLSYYDAEHNDANGKVINHFFPASAGYTPGTVCCDEVGAKCMPDEVPWRTPTWQAIGFLMQDLHRYRYAAIRVSGDGSAVGNQADMYAIGDLNCDGVYGFFSRSAIVGPNFVIQSPGTTSVNELQ